MRLYVFCLFVMVFICGCAPPDYVQNQEKYIRDGKQYGVTEGSFRSRWWNFYERGISFADGRFWAEAEADFRQALKQRDEDKRQARSYGMHFLDYFAHRELGIVLFKQNKFQEAIDELTASLGTVKSAKAEFYLDKARRALMDEQGVFGQRPKIIIEQPADRQTVSGFSILVVGSAESPTYIKEVKINGLGYPIDVGQGRVDFVLEIPMENMGENEIKIEAYDLTGESRIITRTVFVDRQGPVISLQRVKSFKKENIRYFSVIGKVSDEGQVSGVKINNRPMSFTPSQEVVIDQADIWTSGMTVIVLEAEDSAGNKTKAEYDLAELVRETYLTEITYDDTRPPPGPHFHSTLAPISSLIRDPNNLAYVGPDFHGFTQSTGSWGSFDLKRLKSLTDPDFDFFGTHRKTATIQLASLSESIPQIFSGGGFNDRRLALSAEKISLELKGKWTADQVVYLDQVYLEGEARSANPIKSVFINGAPISTVAGQRLFFSKLFKLKEGPNQFTITALGEDGQETNLTITLEKKINEVYQLEERMSVAVLPIEQKSGTPQAVVGVDDGIMASLYKLNRFDLVERQRLDAVLQEQKLSAADLVNKDTAVSLGKIVSASCILMGSALERSESVEIYTRVVDTETSEIIAEVDVYGESVDLLKMNELLDGLALKMLNEFPLIGGKIVAVQNDRIRINIGQMHRIRNGLKLIVYQEDDFGDAKVLADARVVRVKKSDSIAEITDFKIDQRIEPENLIITR